MEAQKFNAEKIEPTTITRRIMLGHAETELPDGYGSTCYVAEHDGTVIGWALVSSIPEWARTSATPEDSAWPILMRRITRLSSIAVDPAARRAGAGTALLDAVMDWSRGHGARAVTVSPHRDNAPVQALYGRAGVALAAPARGLTFLSQWGDLWYATGSPELRYGAIALHPAVTSRLDGDNVTVDGVFDDVGMSATLAAAPADAELTDTERVRADKLAARAARRAGR
jgi:GNAT superfamily N-acetyltransferase